MNFDISVKSKVPVSAKIKLSTKKPAESAEKEASTPETEKNGKHWSNSLKWSVYSNGLLFHLFTVLFSVFISGLVFKPNETITNMTKLVAVFLAKRDKKTSLQKVKKYLSTEGINVVFNAHRINEILKQMFIEGIFVPVVGEFQSINKVFKMSSVKVVVEDKVKAKAKAISQNRKSLKMAEKKKRQIASKSSKSTNAKSKSSKKAASKKKEQIEENESDQYSDDEDVPPHKRIWLMFLKILYLQAKKIIRIYFS